MESGNRLYNLRTGEEEEKETRRQLLYLHRRVLPGFVFVFHISMINSEFLLVPALFRASSGAEN
jgi:hypothetical protein